MAERRALIVRLTSSSSSWRLKPPPCGLLLLGLGLGPLLLALLLPLRLTPAEAGAKEGLMREEGRGGGEPPTDSDWLRLRLTSLRALMPFSMAAAASARRFNTAPVLAPVLAPALALAFEA